MLSEEDSMPNLNEKGYIVRISEISVISLILNALEAYCVQHKNIEYRDNAKLETFGHLFGYEIRLVDERTVYQVEIVNTDTSAEQTKDGVSHNEKSMELKIDTVTSFWPHFEYLGDFHSHPYNSHKQAKKCKGFYFSDGDRKDLTDRSEFWGAYRHRVSLLVTIGPMERAGRRPAQWIDSHFNCVEINLGNFKLWLTAYCSYVQNGKMHYTKDNDQLVTLDCPHLTGLQWEHKRYGRVKTKGKKVDFVAGP